MSPDSLYPPAPTNLPADLTRPAGAYRLRVVAMIAGLFAFVLVYLAFVVSAGLAAYWLLMLPIGGGNGRAVFFLLVVKLGGAFAAILLWLFLFRGLFKRQRVERGKHITLDEREHPALFAFIRRVYEDVGAPPPRNVVVSPEVNAALIYDTSLVNLVIPPKKDLLIGLGLVNVVNLSEFKAVLAHEFGHFAQRSVGLGSYLYVANRVLYDLIYSRDRLDHFVDAWCAQDVRISFPAWALKAVLWAARKILGFVYQGLNLAYLSLSRQMEFNADNVAVSVTGSDALIHGLARLEFANECLVDAARSLDVAADHGLMTDDLFFYQHRAAERLRRVQKKPQAGLPPELPADSAQQVQVFEPIDDGIPDRYRSHPTDHMRAQRQARVHSQHDRRALALAVVPSARVAAAAHDGAVLPADTRAIGEVRAASGRGSSGVHRSRASRNHIRPEVSRLLRRSIRQPGRAGAAARRPLAARAVVVVVRLLARGRAEGQDRGVQRETGGVPGPSGAA